MVLLELAKDLADAWVESSTGTGELKQTTVLKASSDI